LIQTVLLANLKNKQYLLTGITDLYLDSTVIQDSKLEIFRFQFSENCLIEKLLNTNSCFLNIIFGALNL